MKLKQKRQKIKKFVLVRDYPAEYFEYIIIIIIFKSDSKWNKFLNIYSQDVQKKLHLTI